MNRKFRLGIVGCGGFVQFFVPLFKAHPYVEAVYVTDLIKERQHTTAAKYGVSEAESFEALCADPKIDAIAVFVQRHLHGPLVIAALKAGKNVYSAVPCASTVEEIVEIERLVRATGLIYSMGETGYYRACTCFCREKFASGEMGRFVYAEGQYNHDMRNMVASFQRSGGEKWREVAGIPPMLYPTHSTSMILSALPGVYAKKVSAFGYIPETMHDIFGTDGQNLWNNPFANTTMLLQLSNGGIARLSENRCIGWNAPETYISNFHGTDGGYEFSVGKHHYAHWKPKETDDPTVKQNVYMEDVSDLLLPTEISELLRRDYSAGIQKISEGMGFLSASPIQPTAHAPASFAGIPNGHNGTHWLLVDDFCRAMYQGKLTPTNIWAVARYNLPGLVAHQSAMRGGELMDVPDLGDVPANWSLIDYTPYQ